MLFLRFAQHNQLYRLQCALILFTFCPYLCCEKWSYSSSLCYVPSVSCTIFFHEYRLIAFEQFRTQVMPWKKALCMVERQWHRIKWIFICLMATEIDFPMQFQRNSLKFQEYAMQSYGKIFISIFIVIFIAISIKIDLITAKYVYSWKCSN